MHIWCSIIVNEAKTVLNKFISLPCKNSAKNNYMNKYVIFYVTHLVWTTLNDDVTAISCMKAIYSVSWVKRYRGSDVTGLKSSGNEGVYSILRSINVAHLSLGKYFIRLFLDLIWQFCLHKFPRKILNRDDTKKRRRKTRFMLIVNALWARKLCFILFDCCFSTLIFYSIACW